MCDSSHDKLCNLSYRVIQGKGKFTAKTAQKKKGKKSLCWYKNITKRIATKYVKRSEGDKAPGLKAKNKDSITKALRWSEDVLVRYFMILPPRAWIYKEKVSKLPVSNFFSNGTCFKAIFSFLTFLSKLFILTITITWQYATSKSKISMHMLFSLVHCSPPAYSTYQILNHSSSKSKTN